MAKKSFGDIVRKRTYQLLDTMLRFVNSEIYDKDNFKIKFEQGTEGTIIFQTTIKNLVYLTRACGYQLDSHHIKESLHCLTHLKIIEDNRVDKKGNHVWHFSLKIWYPYQHKEFNLERFNQEWDNLKNQL